MKEKSIDIIAQLQSAVLAALLTPLNNIQGALKTIAANPSDMAIVEEQVAVIQGQFAVTVAEAPALLPTLQSELIADGATQVNDLLSQLISDIQSKVASSASGTASATNATGAGA